MRSAFIVIVAALSTTVLSQSLSSLPKCAQNCVGNSLTTLGCNLLNITCICDSATWITELSCCISQTCSPQDQNATITFADQICLTGGVTVPSAVSCASSTTTPSVVSSSIGSSETSTTTTNVHSSSSTMTSSSSSSSHSTPTASATQNVGARDEYGFRMGLAAAGLFAMAL